jgi:endonuclease/exonuclease/phosphatase family metal-dependent hydrolase
MIALCSFAAGASAQTTVTLSTPGTHVNVDVTIQGGAYDMVDFSDSGVLASKVSSESYTRRIMMKFDTQNFIPAKAVIQSAQLHLVLKKAENSENRPLTAYQVTTSFSENQTTWMTRKTGTPWSRPGGDLGSSYGTTYVGNAVGSTYRFDLTRLTQRAVNGDFGSRYTRVALIDTGANTNGNYREFHSTRATNSALRPRLVITYGSSTTTSPTTTTNPAPATTTGTTLRVMQWNIHKTKGSDGVCNPDRIANGIVAQNVHIVSLNEVNFYSGSCAWNFDMGAKLHALIQQKTGVTWYRQHVNSGGVGNVLLSRIRPVSSGSTQLSYTRGVAQMTIVVNGRNVNVFSTHVDYANASYRTLQTGQVVRWASTHGEPRIVMGDFNTWPNTSDYYLMAKPYQDAWAAAKNAGTAWAYNGTGNTRGGSRFDYVYYSRVAALSLKSVKVPDTRVSGVYPSDHDPVVAVFTIN